MKKLLTVLALTLMTMVIALTVAGCGNASSAPTKEEFDALIERIEDLEKENEDVNKKNNNLQNQVNNLNVFWTDKAEYSEAETMTVYFGKTAVFKIRLDSFRWSSTRGIYINGGFYLTSLCADILRESIAASTDVSWDSGTHIRESSTDLTVIAKKNVELQVRGTYKGDGTAYNNATYFDFVVCVPGTPFELARFKNITVNEPL